MEMIQYMADIDLPDHYSAEFVSLIPEQRATINKLLKKGVILNYSLAMDRSKLWVILEAKDEVEARNIIGSFPIFNHIQVKIFDLMFNQVTANIMPQLWLN